METHLLTFLVSPQITIAIFVSIFLFLFICIFISSPLHQSIKVIYNLACRAFLGEEKVKWSEGLAASANAGVKIR